MQTLVYKWLKRARPTALAMGAGLAALGVVRCTERPPVAMAAPGPQSSAAPRALASAGARMPVLLELYTSEGCSSCPPADALLADLVRTQPVEGASIVPLAMHVDYWNRLGWSDPFSSPEVSDRQRGYASARGSSSVYTPQAVVDGAAELNGSDRSAATAAIASAARYAKARVELRVTAHEGATWSLDLRVSELPKVTDGDAAEVIVAVTEDDLRVAVPRGENAGKTLDHIAVVRSITRVAAIGSNGASLTPAVTVDKSFQPERVRVVGFVQERDSRRVLGIGTTALVTH